jgi:RNA polymerase sigma factor (sigma-70 family)
MPRMGTLAGLTVRLATISDETDADWIGRYVRDRDDAAFAAIVRRHGRMVLGVCRRILGDAADADDAFQATFLVLAKKAHRVEFRDDVSAWLFAVAVRASRELLRRRTRRSQRETVGTVPDLGVVDRDDDGEARRVVLDEVARLSDPYRAAVVLCELDGVSRSDAARRLGIPEGTLSSRLAAARKALATRLSARGVALAALAPLGGFLPPALASLSSASPTALELGAFLMRTYRWQSLGAMASVILFAACAGGLCLGDDPKPPTVKPASAQVVEPAESTDRIILAFREDVRFLDHDGRETLRIDIAKAKKADPDLITGTLTIGNEGIKLSRFLPIVGRPGPGGVLPIESNGLKFIVPGNPPRLLQPKSHSESEGVAGWSPDGRAIFTFEVERSAVWGAIGHKAYRVEVASGERTALPFGQEHELLDVSADGRSFLTKRHRARVFGIPGFHDGFDYCVLNAAGEVQRNVLKGKTDYDFSAHRLSPDGQFTAEIAKPKDAAKHRTIYTLTSQSKQLDIAQVYCQYRRNEGDFECRAVAWSPDGKRIVSVWTPYSWKDKLKWHVVVGEAGGRLKKVSVIETAGDEQLRSLDWR